MSTLQWCLVAVSALGARGLEDSAVASQAADALAARLSEARAVREHQDRVAERLDARLMRWQDGHAAAEIHGLAFSPDGELLLTSGADGTAHLWDAYTSRHLAALGPFARDARAAFDASGEHVLVVDRQAARATLWDGRSGELRAELGVDGELVLDAAFAPSGGGVLTATATGLVRRWDAALAQPVGAIETPGVIGLRVAPVSTDPAGTPGTASVLALCADERARLCELERGELGAIFGDDARGVIDARFAPDGKELVTLGKDGSLAVEALDGLAAPRLLNAPGAELFDGMLRRGADRCLVRVGVRLALWKVGGGTVELVDPARSLAQPECVFSPDGRRVLVQSVERPTRSGLGAARVVRLWDADTCERVADLALDTEWMRPFAAAFAPDGRRLAVGERGFRPVLFDAASGAELGAPEGLADSIRCLAFSPDGARLVAGSYRGYAALWQVERASDPLYFQPRSRTVWGWQQGLSPDGRWAVMAGFPRGLRDPLATRVAHVWDLSTGMTSRTLSMPGAALHWGVFDPESAHVATAGNLASGEGVVCVWDLGSSEPPRVLACGTGTITGLVFNAGRLCSTVVESGVRLWDVASGELLADFPELAGAQVGWAVLGPDGSTLAAPGPAGGVFFWDERSDERPRALGGPAGGHRGLVRNVAFSPDGERLVSAGLDGTARVWEVPSGRELVVLASPAGVVHWAEFGRAGRVVVTGEPDHTARVWDAASGALVTELRGHESSVTQVVVAPAGDRVLTLNPGGDPRVFTLPEGRLVAVLSGHTAPVGGAAFSSDGRRILTSGLDDAVRLWDGEGRPLLTRVAFERGEWLALEPHGYYVGTEQAADWARIELSGATVPLSSYASLLCAPAKVAAALAGESVAAPPPAPTAPALRLVAPRERAVESRRFQVDLRLEDRYGIAAVTVLQDGVELSVPEPELEPGRRGGRLAFEAEIPADRGETTLAVRAANERGILSAEEIVYVRYEPPKRDLYLLTLAVADYADDELDLECPARDAEDLARRLVGERGGLYRDVRVEAVADRAVTSGTVLKLRDEFLRRAGPEDTVVVFVAGHGARSAAGDYYFLTSDATPARPHDGLERRLLESLVDPARLAARRLVLLIDTCMSGSEVEEARTRGVPLRGGPFSQHELDERSASGRYILTASSPFGLAREVRGNGLFTKGLLEGLDGAADEQGDGDGLVEVEELMAFARRYVLEESDGVQEPSAPLVEGGGNFPLARARARGH